MSGQKGDSRPLVEDGCRSVVIEGGPEVDLQGAVTVGRGGGGGQGTVTIRLNTVQSQEREIHARLRNHTRRSLPSKGFVSLKQVQQTAVASGVSLSKHEVRKL